MNSVFKITSGILISILISVSVKSQENFQPGYIIDLKGDTVKGQIHDAQWEKNPEKIRFRKGSNEKVENLTPIEIEGFSVGDIAYKSAVVDIETSPWDLQDMNKDATFHTCRGTVFLRELITGIKSLYEYTSRLYREQYYIGGKEGPELLLYKEYLKADKSTDYKHMKAENNKYKGQLILYMQDCPNIQKLISPIQYNEKSLRKLFMNYLSCKGLDMDIKKEQSRVSFKWGLLAGISRSSLKITGDYYPELQSADIPKTTDFSFGVNLDIIFKGNQGKWSIYNELLRSAYSVDIFYSDYVNEKEHTDYDLDIALDYIKINNMVRFSYPVGSFTLYANAGISNGFAFKYTNEAIKSKYFYDTFLQTTQPAVEDLRTHEVGALLGGGARFKQFSLDFRYESGDGFSKHKYLKTRATRLYILMGYRF